MATEQEVKEANECYWWRDFKNFEVILGYNDLIFKLKITFNI